MKNIKYARPFFAFNRRNVTIPIHIKPKKSTVNKSKYVRAEKLITVWARAFFRGSLVCRDTASIDNCENILFDDFRKIYLVFGIMGGFYAGHYKSAEIFPKGHVLMRLCWDAPWQRVNEAE